MTGSLTQGVLVASGRTCGIDDGVKDESGETGFSTRRVPIRPVRGVGSTRYPCLYEAEVDGELYVAWEGPAGELHAISARCPHRPHRAALHLRGVLNGDTLICTIHGNVYSTTTGECVSAAGVDDPGRLAIVAGRREGNQMVLKPRSSDS